jgi:hypothetical protein
MIVGFQIGLLRIFEPLLLASHVIWPTAFYTTVSLCAVTSGLVVLLYPEIRQRFLPILLVSAAALVLVGTHPLDTVAKSYVVALAILMAVPVLASVAGTTIIAQFSALATTLSAVICIVDILYPLGFSNTLGRAAGLSINPNLAAAALFLSAVGTAHVVPRYWRGTFVILVAYSIVLTLSRSVILSAAVSVLVWAVARLRRNSSRFVLHKLLSWRKIRNSSATGLGLLALSAVIIYSNGNFQIAVGEAIYGSANAISAYNKAIAVIDRSLRLTAQPTEPPKSHTDLNSVETRQALGPLSTPNHVRKKIKLLGEEARSVDLTNSASSRALLLQRSLLAFASGPFLGRGLQVAQNLSPHNTFLLFAVGFGYLGWLVPAAFIALGLYYGGIQRGYFSVALGCIFLTSHDALLSPTLVVPIAVGLATVGSYGKHDEVNSRVGRSIAATALTSATLFCVGLWMAAHGPSKVRLPLERHWFHRGDDVNSVSCFMPRPPFAGLLRLAPEKGIQLFENGRLFADRPTSAPLITSAQRGQFRLWKDQLIVFSAPDNADPMTSNRSYSIKTAIEIHPLAWLVAAAMIGWSMVVFFCFGRVQPSRPHP